MIDWVASERLGEKRWLRGKRVGKYGRKDEYER